jgi:membrane carboxypeptidase/penicillin-binding protein PbpC
VETTLDPRVQQIAQQAVSDAEGVRALAHANNTSVVVIDTATSQVLGMVGSKNFNDTSIAGQVNVALAGRQPGSSIKPLVYLTGFEKGLYPAVQVDDVITPFSAPPGQPAYVPANYEDKYYGRISLRDAVGNSLNVPAVKVLKYVGVATFKDMAKRLGITTLDDWDNRWLSLTLGGGEVRLLELTNAYAAIAREGWYLPAEPFLKVTNAQGEIVYKDTWTVGCLPQVCVGVWMGNTDNRAMVKVSSSLTAGKVWVDTIMALAAEYNWSPDEFPVPDGVIVVPEAPTSGARPQALPHTEVYLPGQQERPALLNMNWMQPD